MLKRENYPNAYKEVYVILNNMNKEDVKLIPTEFMNMIKKNMNDEYDFNLEGDDFEKQELLKETRAILAYIFMHYWATEEQKERINKKFKQDIINEELLKGNYNRNELFKYKVKNDDSEIKMHKDKNEIKITEYKKESIIKKIINIIKDVFLKK